MKLLKFLEPNKQKKLWKKLRDEALVPVVTNESYKNRNEILKKLKEDIQKHDYFPKLLHGYLGMCKQRGSTRFVPVMQKEDFAVYYACTSALQEHLLNDDIEGVFGGWKMTSSSKSRKNADESIADYVNDSSLSIKLWIENWQSYTDLLLATCKDHDGDIFFHTTDIANFYDSIDLNKLEQKIKKDIDNWDGTVDVLIHLLKYWNRVVDGYNPSSKSIPQEFVQDASRLLANFYLKNFDIEIKKECEIRNIRYLRWADDLLFIHSSPEDLENIVHIACKKLLKIGLNLNSSKTKLYTSTEFIRYRCLDILEKLHSQDIETIEKGIKIFKELLSTGEKIRKDSVYKRLLTILMLKPFKNLQFTKDWEKWSEKQAHKKWLKFCLMSDGYETISFLEGNKLKYLIYLFNSCEEGISDVTEIFCSKPYAHPKAALLKVFEKIIRENKKNKEIFDSVQYAIEIIEKSSQDSIILTTICIPHSRSILKSLFTGTS